ncbi:hypothetical protein [Chryseobacterium cucumeris]|uniref:hypothetical protein n=1 Tax=Chryseobacterium cucumeris TaxID=1813611 RepID=UPI0024558848|nr:hypothetical protein [Chryseobacterium cucumeris]MDH5033080.1 hypothetical protein [Chryseobacterium cucumeris]
MMKNFLTLILLISMGSPLMAQNQSAIPYKANDSVMVTVILRHMQENPVDSIQARVMKQKFYQKLNKSHTRIVSWNVVMGIGQIITLIFKPEYTREVNQVFESGAWGGFKTEFYPSYDFLPVYPVMLEKEKKLSK